MKRVVLGLLVAGCAKVTVTPDAGRTPECQASADCPAGKVCTSEKYCDFCATSGQCTVKETCAPDTLLCTLRPGWGTNCALNEDCQAGFWCKQGLCVDRAEVSLCVSGPCPQGERCNRVTTVCEEDLGCSTDPDCSPDEVCNQGSRTCVPRCTSETQAQVCAASERCVTAKCVQCVTDSECGVGLTCDAAGRCSAPSRCYTDRDCQVPLACLVETGACLPKRPPCLSDDTCATDRRCDVPSGRCLPRSCQPDRAEPDDDASHAFSVAPGTYRGLTLCSGDFDWYAVALSRGDQLGVNLDTDPFSEFTFRTEVKDSQGRTLAVGRLLVSTVAATNATYFVVISSSDPFQKYDVTFLKSRGTPCDDDSHEPNDAAAQSTALNASSTIDGVICPQDQDWFRVSVPASHGFKARLTNYQASRGLLRLCVFDGTASLGCSAEVSPEVVVPAGLSARSLLVRVVGDTDRLSNVYTLAVEFP